jgi:hypothetical protein
VLAGGYSYIVHRPTDKLDRGDTGSGRASERQRDALAPGGLGAPRSAGEPRWRTLIASIRAIQMELKRHRPHSPIGLAGNPAAPESAILVTELRLGRRLPPSYREFLAFSDGWPCFFADATLLGTGSIGRPEQLDPANERLLARGRLLPFGADRAGTSLFAFDTSVRLADGELTVVAWVGGLGLDCRCFTSFLATVLQLCRAELVSARTEASPRQASPAVSKWLHVG